MRFEITGQFKDALTHKAYEAVRLKRRTNYELMDSKSKLNQPPVARIIVDRKGERKFLKIGFRSSAPVC